MESTDVGDGSAPARDAPARPGQMIGPYRVEQLIGSGAMGSVYAAIEPSGRRIAVKLMHPRGYYGGASSVGSRRTDAWLRNEARALSRLSHPNVVGVLGVGSEQGRPYMAMELVEGQTLAEWLQHDERDWERTLAVCVEAARGLAAAHEAGVMHGDFKPDNVMVATDGRVLVMDFGLSRSMSRQARASTETAIPAITDDLDSGASEAWLSASDDSLHAAPLDDDELGEWDTADADADASTARLRRRAGTPAYMAPELLAGIGGDARSDQFSLCVTVYKALFGQRPYGGRTPSEIAFRVARNDLRQCPPGYDVPSWVHAAVTRGLAIEPDDRWRSVSALVNVFAHGLAQRRRRRQRAIAVAVSLAVLLTVALAFIVSAA